MGEAAYGPDHPSGQAVQQLGVSLEQFSRPAGEVLVDADSLDLRGEGVHDESVNAGPAHPGHGLGLVGKLFGQPNGRLLGHDTMMS